MGKSEIHLPHLIWVISRQHKGLKTGSLSKVDCCDLVLDLWELPVAIAGVKREQPVVVRFSSMSPGCLNSEHVPQN